MVVDKASTEYCFIKISEIYIDLIHALNRIYTVLATHGLTHVLIFVPRI